MLQYSKLLQLMFFHILATFHYFGGYLSRQARQSAEGGLMAHSARLYCACMGAVLSGRAGQGKVRFYYFIQTQTLRSTPTSPASTLRILSLPSAPPLGRRVKKEKMTSLDPLKSVISIINVDDTSLALPSVNQYRSGQQRVLEQVQTIRRTKSRQSSSRSGSASTPTSPVYDSVFIDTFKSQLSPSNGGVFLENGFSKVLSQEKNNIKGSTVKRNTAASAYQYERSYTAVGSKAVGQTNTSRSEPDLAWQRLMPKRSLPPQRLASNRGNYRAQRSISQFITSTTSQPQPKPMPQPQPQYTINGTSQTKTNTQFVCSQVDGFKTSIRPSVTEGTPRSKGDSGSNGNSGIADITMKEAVEYLSNSDETYQHCGASYIQHNTFINDKAKDEVFKFNGIPPLVGLLRSPSLQVSHTASAALRNLSFKSNSNKEEIHRCGGITEAVALLRDTDSAETEKQLTGLLWNLSSVDSLKPDLLKSALPVLMERVILPYTTGPDRTNSDPEAFFHTTGCLRNLSSAKQNNRQAMRKCRGLIDSLVKYVKNCVEAGQPDDKSVENCVCILHNLTFQLEAEAPALFSRITTLAKTVMRNHSQDDIGPIGCFSPQSKSPEHEHFDFPVVEDPQPHGAGWLIHSETLQSYLSLLGSSQQEETQEACCGALQNLTTNEGIVSGVMSQIIVQKLNGLQVISPLLKSSKVNLQRNTTALVGNLTKNPNLHSVIARKALPELLSVLSAGTKEGNESDDTLAMACQTTNYLLMKEPEMSKRLLNNNLINSLNDLSQNEYFPKTRKAAALLLYNLWSEKDLQSFLKKQGMSKSSFVNDVTTAAHKSVQIVD
ncbi:plakophilin-1-like isoform X2 [Morone saxatilis]|uniref:plakophilin-1-like isoform X2 n=1 Tax=Morone saxatilis TaxID=34816 RepID=UPI0015E21C46|nr:plakophilin-1-like isoform X2 [Morone saxatilis]